MTRVDFPHASETFFLHLEHMRIHTLWTRKKAFGVSKYVLFELLTYSVMGSQYFLLYIQLTSHCCVLLLILSYQLIYFPETSANNIGAIIHCIVKQSNTQYTALSAVLHLYFFRDLDVYFMIPLFWIPFNVTPKRFDFNIFSTLQIFCLSQTTLDAMLCIQYIWFCIFWTLMHDCARWVS